ncbi:unnamed protein product, partial [Scytosiphon promiscuus]
MNGSGLTSGLRTVEMEHNAFFASAGLLRRRRYEYVEGENVSLVEVFPGRRRQVGNKSQFLVPVGLSNLLMVFGALARSHYTWVLFHTLLTRPIATPPYLAGTIRVRVGVHSPTSATIQDNAGSGLERRARKRKSPKVTRRIR